MKQIKLYGYNLRKDLADVQAVENGMPAGELDMTIGAVGAGVKNADQKRECDQIDDGYEYQPRQLSAEIMARYCRPDDSGGGKIDSDTRFMLCDISNAMDRRPGSYWGPVIRLYCVTEAGTSAAIEIRSFFPYFFVAGLPEHVTAETLAVAIEAKLNWAAAQQPPVWGEHSERICMPRSLRCPDGIRYCVAVEATRFKPLMGYRPPDREWVPGFKLVLRAPGHVHVLRKMLERGMVLDTVCITCEANIPYILRFLADVKLAGCQWFTVRNPKFLYRRYHQYTTDYEVMVPEEAAGVVPISIDKLSLVGPFRWATFDLECLKLAGRGFVDPEVDPVCHIAVVIRAHPSRVLDSVVFALVPPGRHVVIPAEFPQDVLRIEEFTDERDLLMRFRNYVVDSDLDVFTGWNINGFDWNYLFTRARVLGLRDWNRFTRERYTGAGLRAATFTSAAYGTREDYATTIEGRFDFDMYKYIVRDMKLRSYKLNYVLQLLFERNKVDMPYRLIPAYQNGTDEQRGHLSWYCFKDAEECLAIADARKAVNNSAEQARICGIPLKWLVSRGQQIKICGKLLPLGNAHGFKLPSSTKNQNAEETRGAIVKDPKRGWYTGPVITLDFASLYPSIMRAFNISYETKVLLSQLAEYGLTLAEVLVPPIPGVKFCFVKHHIRKGLLGIMEEDLMNNRARVKVEMKAERDAKVKEVLDARQNALKIVCNSAYGFVKANMICDKDLMEAVTAWGRQLLETTSDYVTYYYATTKQRYAEAQRIARYMVRVVPTAAMKQCMFCWLCKLKWETTIPASDIVYQRYGDTDSVMIYFSDAFPFASAKHVGYELAARCTRLFNAPIKLEFEKIMQPFLLQGKKRYDAIAYLGEAPGVLLSKGDVNVRRDNARIGSETREHVLNLIMFQKDVEGAIRYIQEVVRKLLTNQVDISLLVISKGLTKSEKEYEAKGGKQLHVELAKKIAARSHATGEEPYATGDRVRYVMVKGDKKSQAWERAEDPLYALKNQISIDANYYIEKQLVKWACRMFTPILAKEELVNELRVDTTTQAVTNVKVVGKMQDTFEMRNGARKDISETKYRKLTAYQRLFTGEHTKTKTQVVSKVAGGISAFLVPLHRCFQCNAPLSGLERGVCKTCQPRRAHIQLAMQQEADTLVAAQTRAWQQCQTCVGAQVTPIEELTVRIECDNCDCENFFVRTKLDMDVRRVRDKLAMI